MHDKKNKKIDKSTKKTNKTTNKVSKHVFEVHTMESDNKLKQAQNLNKENLNKEKMSVSNKKKMPASSVNEKNKSTDENPFLNAGSKQSLAGQKGSFAPKANSEKVGAEKINFDTKDIAPQTKTNVNKQKKSSLGKVMGFFVVLILIIGIGAVVYYFMFSDLNKQTDDLVLENPNNTENEVNNETLLEEDVDEFMDEKEMESEMEQIYSTELPNYFSFDVENVNTEEHIASEMQLIATNMKEQGIDGPISFIITDTNSNPVSFNVFAMSAGIKLPMSISSLLEESFELWAYNDFENGVRFGFVVDTKSEEELKDALLLEEVNLPLALDPILNGFGADATDVVFKDSVYNTYSIRYYNLNKEESYSVDYGVANNKWVVGTTKKTLRAILDSMNTNVEQNDLEYLDLEPVVDDLEVSGNATLEN
jgi:hypothetical protein